MNRLTIPFHNNELLLIDDHGQPYVAMRPIVEGMGLDWKSQQRKLQNRFESSVVMMTTTGKDGKSYSMLCLPLRHLPAWLYSINVNKVKPDAYDAVKRYQAECDDVLWQYWTSGIAKRDDIQEEMARVKTEEKRSQQRGSKAGYDLYVRKLEKHNYQLRLQALQRELGFVWEVQS